MKNFRLIQIRNSTAEFLIFAEQNETDTIEVRFEDETLWLTQQLMAQLFDTTRANITQHMTNIFPMEKCFPRQCVKISYELLRTGKTIRPSITTST